jgi:hypothetical protein
VRSVVWLLARTAAVLLPLVTVPRAARGEDVAVEARARQDFAEGVRLFQLGDFDGARASFLRADAVRHAPAIVFNLARAEEKLGNVQAALDAYEAYLREAGTGSDLGLAASVAVAQLKERATRLRIESEPAGANVEIDGRATSQRTPALVYVRAGEPHRVRVTAIDLDETRATDARAPGEEVALSFHAGAGDATHASRFYAGGGLALVTYHFIGAKPLPGGIRFADETNVTLGGSIEGGIRILPRLYLGLDLLAAVGTYGHPNYVVGGSVGVAYRFDLGLWLRGAATIADVDSNKTGRTISTDVVLGPAIEVAYEIDREPFGAWFVAVGAALLPADAQRDTDAVFFPLRLGVRAM